MLYREFHYRWEYDLKASPEKLWPFVSDTNRFNRDTNVPALEVQPAKQRLRNARRRAKLSIFGMPVQWEELPRICADERGHRSKQGFVHLFNRSYEPVQIRVHLMS